MKNNKNQIRVAIYKRVSTLEQAIDGSSLQAQEDLLINYIKANEDKGRVLEEGMIFSDDGVSGAKENRPGLDALKEEIVSGNIDAILVLKIDRLFRETQFLLTFVKFLESYGVDLISKNEEINTKQAMGKFFLTLLGAFASMERDLIRERTIMGKIQKSKEGYFVGGNMPPTGYRLDGDKKMQIDEDEAKIIKEIFNLSKEGKTNEEISKIISSKGYETKFEKNKKDTSKRIKKIKNFWHARTIGKILRDTTYKGVYYYGKTTTEYDVDTKTYKTIQVPIEDRIKFNCPKIIDDDIFEIVQENIDKNKRVGRGQVRIFTGKIVCGLCGFKYHGYKSSKGTMNYSCHNSYLSRAGSEKNRCINTGISEEILRDLSLKKIYELIEDPKKFYSDYINNDKEFNKVLKSIKKEVDDLTYKISELVNKHKNLFDELTNFSDKNSKNIIREKIDQNSEKIEVLENRKKEVEVKLLSLNKERFSLQAIEDFINSYKIKLKNLSREQENDLIEMFVNKVVVNFDDIVIELNIRGNSNDKDGYKKLKQKMEEYDNENKKKLEITRGGEKTLNNCNDDSHLHI